MPIRPHGKLLWLFQSTPFWTQIELKVVIDRAYLDYGRFGVSM